MSSTTATKKLPPSGPDQVYVSVSALQGGHLTLPEALFITNAEPGKRATVPSLSFLIQHPAPTNDQATSTASNKLVFDLGLKRDLSRYAPAQQNHISQRQPTILHPDVSDSLRIGGLDPAKDIDEVIVSHVHWDHVGTSSDFERSKFLVGSGTLHVLEHGAGPHYPAEIFNKDELPLDRTYEFPPPDEKTAEVAAKRQTEHNWHPLATFPAAIDYFGDESLFVIDTPGHLLGHANLLARIGERKWAFLGGDCCHDSRILEGESGIAMYPDGHGGKRSVHMDTEEAGSSLQRIKELVRTSEDEIEMVIAHDKGWMEKNPTKFFPGRL
jgi:glyoxylase-like metal-dependent hydrolase (beta-lactamase superfamily II)